MPEYTLHTAPLRNQSGLISGNNYLVWLTDDSDQEIDWNNFREYDEQKEKKYAWGSERGNSSLLPRVGEPKVLPYIDLKNLLASNNKFNHQDGLNFSRR